MKKNVLLVMGIMYIATMLCLSGCGSSATRCSKKKEVASVTRRDVDAGLLEAVLTNDIANVKMLLMCDGADANVKNSIGHSALYIACMNGCTEIAQLLLAHGADPNAKNEFGEMPLPMAASQDYKEIVVSLLKHGADVNAQEKDGSTALFYANTEDMKELLFAHGADPKIEDNNGRCAICMGE